MISAQMAITGDGRDHRTKGALEKPGGATALPRPRDDRWVQRSPRTHGHCTRTLTHDA